MKRGKTLDGKALTKKVADKCLRSIKTKLEKKRQ